jgi:N4-(beta-N-acetylglucosaminyl)-L-asparaginase
MGKKLSRREFVKTGAAAGLAAASTRTALASSPTLLVQKTVKPVVIASSNGNVYKNGGTETCVARAFRLVTEGKDVLDALVAGVNIVELDPLDMGVGYSGLPNADGVVQLDSCCMHGPAKRAGGVAAIEGVRTPSLVWRTETTDHHLLVGKGAQDFARNMGFTVEDDLNTPESRKLWLEWKRRIDPEHYLDPKKRADASLEAGLSMVRDGLIDPNHFFGTINCDGIAPNGDICGVTTTSGLAWKIAGRVGDSPILGAGLYVDGDVGAAGSTGRGEANLYNLSSFFVVEEMRRGKHPKDAAMEALRRVQKNTVEKRSEQARLPARAQLLRAQRQGEYAGVSMYGGRLVP